MASFNTQAVLHTHTLLYKHCTAEIFLIMAIEGTSLLILNTPGYFITVLPPDPAPALLALSHFGK